MDPDEILQKCLDHGRIAKQKGEHVYAARAVRPHETARASARSCGLALGNASRSAARATQSFCDPTLQ